MTRSRRDAALVMVMAAVSVAGCGRGGDAPVAAPEANGAAGVAGESAAEPSPENTSGQRFVGVPYVYLERGTSPGRPAVYNPRVVVRLSKALPLDKAQRPRAFLAVDNEVSVDGNGRIGLISRHCYTSLPIEGAAPRPGQDVTVSVTGTGVNVTRRVAVHGSYSRGRVNDMGCGGRLREKLNGPPLRG